MPLELRVRQSRSQKMYRYAGSRFQLAPRQSRLPQFRCLFDVKFLRRSSAMLSLAPGFFHAGNYPFPDQYPLVAVISSSSRGYVAAEHYPTSHSGRLLPRSPHAFFFSRVLYAKVPGADPGSIPPDPMPCIPDVAHRQLFSICVRLILF
jgi:hypothetical protein